MWANKLNVILNTVYLEKISDFILQNDFMFIRMCSYMYKETIKRLTIR